MTRGKLLASIRPKTWDNETQTFEAVASTGAPVARRDAAGVYMEELDIASIDPATVIGLPLLDSHRTESIEDQHGKIVAARVERGELIVTAHVDNPRTASRVESGVLDSLSIGYSPLSVREQTDSKTRVRTKTLRVKIHEVSLVVSPADQGSKIRKESIMDPEIETPETPAPTEAEVRAQTRAEVRDIMRRAGATPEQADELIDRDATPEQARAAAYDLMQARTRQTSAIRARVIVSHDDPAALLQRQIGGLAARALGKAPADNEREFYALTVPEHGDAILRRHGISTTGLTREQRLTRALGVSDLPELLSGVGSRALLSAYQVAGSPLIALAKKSTLTDFRPSARLRAGELGSLEPLGEHGEIKHTSRTESKHTIELETFGRRIDYSMKAMLNDDLNALTDASEAFGIAAAARDAAELVALLESNPEMDDGEDLFSAAHNNLETNPAAIMVEAISAARLAMRSTVGLDGETLLQIAPKFLVVSKELETEGEQFLATYTPASFGETNPFASKLTLVVEPRLAPWTWYLAAPPEQAPVLEMARLAGRDGPQIESQQAWDTWGVSFRCIHHVGVAAIGHRGWFKFADGQTGESE